VAETAPIRTFFRSWPTLYTDVQIPDGASAGQLRALAANPVTLIPAPGANKAIIVLRVHLVFDVTTTGYTEPSAPDNIVIEYGDGTDIVEVDATGFITANTDQVRHVWPAYAGGAAAAGMTPVANSSVRIANNSTEWTGGNAANTLSIRTEYIIVPTIAFGTT
jgi:hypothetical protein